MKDAQGAAPADMIRQDFRTLDARETLRTTWPIEQMILIQSVHGHCHEGHGVFRGRRFPNTGLDDVVRALRLDPLAVQSARQALINGVAWYVDQAVAGTPPPAVLDANGDPLLGISTFRYLRPDATQVLRGLFLGGLRDDSSVRQEVEQQHGVRIGGGACYHVDYRKMRQLGLDADELAHGEWADQIQRFREDGMIVSAERAHEPGVTWQYIRDRRGPGASDDAAIVAAGLLWGVGAAIGVFLADAVDTLEKYVAEYSDQDEGIARAIESRCPSLGIGMKEARTLTYLAAVPDDTDISIPDSSLRHLLAIDREADLCAMESHILTVQGVPVPSIGLSHERTPSGSFYNYMRARIDAL